MTEQVTEEYKEKEVAPWDETIRTVLMALVLALLFRSFLYEPFHIPSGSMKNNLLVGDYLFVSKYSYGYSRYSFPLGIVPIKDRIMGSQPERGDVVVFRLPSDPSVDFIKRIIGLPGDHVQVKEGIVYLNGKALPREPLENFIDTDDEVTHTSIPSFKETLPNGKSYVILKQHQFGTADNTEEFIVPEDHFFMMGDNRDNSTDSRFSQVGFVPYRNLVGHAQMIFMSVDSTAKLINPITWFGAIRADRFFKFVH